MTLLETNNHLVLSKIDAWEIGSEGGIAEIMREHWESIGSPGERKSFGRLFKDAVLNKRYPKIQWLKIQNSGRYDVYKKL